MKGRGGSDDLSALRTLLDMADHLPIGLYRTTTAGVFLEANAALVEQFIDSVGPKRSN
mgnify:CR=1 FL=1